MRNVFFFHIFTSLALIISACDSHEQEKGEIGKTAEDFAIAYFNLGDDDSYFDEERRTRPLDEAYFSQSAASVGFEFGKLWYMTDMWNVGAGVQMLLDSPDRTDEDDENIYYTLAFKIMIVRK